ncbi:MAG TPA: multiheme c-type cytochrome [Candidatus Limnocylindrales bacterium]|nr:multiheme c-type cytochrome [Candidatus Limnocylindrales bacterium]
MGRRIALGPTFAVGLLVSAVATAAAQEPRYLGAASCASSVCHGALIGRDGASVLQNEYIVWSEEDRHARAYEVLLEPRSAAIAANLGIPAAHEAALCLDCHATNAARAARGPKFQISDGVSCESCHGAASRWIETHDDSGRSHADNVAAGMVALEDVGVRAQVCVSCHVGDDDRFVSHRIMAAGHPRTSFELDTFTHLQPRHYRVDEDYRRRKGEVDGVQAWAVGQAAVLVDYFDRLAGHAGGDAVWPEFALFDCFSCHHSIGSQRAGGGVRPAASLGIPSVLRASAIMYEAAAATAGVPSSARIDSGLHELEAALARRGGDAVSQARSLRQNADSGLRHLARWQPRRGDLHELLARLSSRAAVARYRSYSDAEQATMAVQAVVASLADRGELAGERGRLTAAVDGLFDVTSSEAAFRPEDFASAMARVASLAAD